MDKPKGFSAILIPSATVFLSSACIMIIELVAGRLIARHLGSSLYTWTSIIGVVLAGITIGNYLGGRIADKFHAQKALASLFGLASVACVVIVILNNVVGEWIFLWKFSWPARVFCHVSLVFLLPSTLLGTISPVVAKMALDKGLSTGRTIGEIYAWGAAGSIAGTFLAGFYLIAAMGTIAIIWTIAAALLLMGILYHRKLWPLYVWAVIFIVLVMLGLAPSAWAGDIGSSLLLRKKTDPKVLYEAETQYCYVAVKQLSKNPDQRAFMQDKLKHSDIDMENIENLQYFYTNIYAGMAHEFSKKKASFTAMVIGGGGYVFPQYLKKKYPSSKVDVVEIDPGVTEAAMAAFGLPRNTEINSIPMDARNYVDQLIEQQTIGKKTVKYDLIYEDAINDFSVPFQLVTYEFNEKIQKILTSNGIYMINLIDMYDSGMFLGAVVNTVKKSFDYVYVITGQITLSSLRDTYVVIASNQPLDTKGTFEDFDKHLKLWYFDESDIDYLNRQSKGVVLTDDYAPVENLLIPVVKQSAKETLARRYLRQAENMKKDAKWDKSIENYKKAAQFNPSMTIKAYNEIALMESGRNNLEAALEAFLHAIKYHDQQEFAENVIGSIYLNTAIILQKLGRTQEASQNYQRAIEELYIELNENPNEAGLWNRLGDALASSGKMEKASEAFKKALSLDRTNMLYYDNVISALKYQKRTDEAIKILQDGMKIMAEKKDIRAVNWFKYQIGSLQNNQQKIK